MRKRRNARPNWPEVELRFRVGEPVADLARKYDLHEVTIFKHCSSVGIARPPLPSLVSRHPLAAALLRKGWPARRVARVIGSADIVPYTVAREMGIALTSKGGARSPGGSKCGRCGDIVKPRRGLCAPCDARASLERKKRDRSTPEGRARYLARKQAEGRLRSRRLAERAGRIYVPIAERPVRRPDPIKEALRDLRGLRRNRLKVWVRLLIAQEPRYTEAKPNTLAYAARYRFDPVFRLKEQTRANLREAWKAGSSDGTLDGKALTGLFAAAKHCHYCRRPIRGKEKTLDHVIPLSRGGAHSIHNAVIACSPCNNSKKARTPEEWRDGRRARMAECLSRCAA